MSEPKDKQAKADEPEQVAVEPEQVAVELKVSWITDGPIGAIVMMDRDRAEGFGAAVEIIPAI